MAGDVVKQTEEVFADEPEELFTGAKGAVSETATDG